MKKRVYKPEEGKDYLLLPNGVIKVPRLNGPPSEPSGEKAVSADYLSLVDHSLAIASKAEYEKRMSVQEERLNTLVRKFKEKRLSLIIVLQGRDGAGKSGAAERILQALDYDPKIFLWVPIGPPNDEEKDRPYLWRFFRHDRMPAFGQVRVFDRSWAERLLVEPVMKIIDKPTLERSYPEIRSFEWLLTRQGAVLVKLWMDITKDEQLRRFQKRAKEKPWKVSPSDMEARERWDDYTEVANAMFHLTGTDYAPWHIISSEDKRYSRVTVLETVNAAMKAALKSNFRRG